MTPSGPPMSAFSFATQAAAAPAGSAAGRPPRPRSGLAHAGASMVAGGGNGVAVRAPSPSAAAAGAGGRVGDGARSVMESSLAGESALVFPAQGEAFASSALFATGTGAAPTGYVPPPVHRWRLSRSCDR